MVMTLRKRVAPVRKTPSPSPSPSSSPVKKMASKSRRITKPSRGKRARMSSDSDSESGSSSSSEEESTEYEKFREERMRENRERMEKLGIFALSSKMFDSKAAKNRRQKKTLVKKKRSAPLFPRTYEPRRSSRLKDHCVENERTLKDMGISIPDSWTDEVYTEEDEKLLGDCETPWTLNVDGFGEDGEPLYDPVNGTSCHQSRQKTLRKHTFCCKCRSGQGQLCGDCLYTRYGENVAEAMKNPEWLCPACRGICNCSRCRRAKGWPPVTILYPKVLEAGFKSVAHYLILSRRAGNKQIEPQDETAVVDLTNVEATTQAEQGDKGSDNSEWCESESEADDSDSDNDDSPCNKKHSEESMEEQADATEVVNVEPAGNAEFQEEMMVFSEGPSCQLFAGI